ncbi:MAG: hypothetical protein ACRDVC_00130 [Acidimicrobiales bacterium]
MVAARSLVPTVSDEVSRDRARLIRPADKGTLQHHEVGSSVGSVKNDGPELVEPLAG